MIGSIENGWGRLRFASFLAALAALLLVMNVGSAVADELPPTIANGKINLTSLPPEGGIVTVSAEVADPDGVAAVDAEVSGSDGSSQTVEMTVASGAKYSGKVTLPPNFGEAAVKYQFSVAARDSVGNSATKAVGEATVKAAPVSEVDEPPTVKQGTFSVKRLPVGGGTVTLEVVATDDHAVADVEALVTRFIGTNVSQKIGTDEVPMEPVGGDRYRATYAVPATTSAPYLGFEVSFVAHDNFGQRGSTASGSFIQEGIYAVPTCHVGSFNIENTEALHETMFKVWGPLHRLEVCPVSGFNGGPEESFLKTQTTNPSAFFESERPPSFREIAEARSGASWHVVTIPVAQTSIAIVATPPTGCKVTKITNRQLEQVFRGKIALWSELFTAPQTASCEQPLTRVVPATASSIATRFKRYLARMNSSALPCLGRTWLGLTDTAGGDANALVNLWPEGCSGVKSKLSKVSLRQEVPTVGQTPGSIGFGSLAQSESVLKGTSIKLELENDGQLSEENRTTAAAASYARPIVGGRSANCGGTTYTIPLGARPDQSGLDVDWSEVDGGLPAVGGTYYPLCTLSFFVGYSGRHVPNREDSFLRALDFLNLTVLSPRGQERLVSKWAWPLPSSPETWHNVLLAAKNAAAKVSY